MSLLIGVIVPEPSAFPIAKPKGPLKLLGPLGQTVKKSSDLPSGLQAGAPCAQSMPGGRYVRATEESAASASCSVDR